MFQIFIFFLFSKFLVNDAREMYSGLSSILLGMLTLIVPMLPTSAMEAQSLVEGLQSVFLRNIRVIFGISRFLGC